MGKHPEQTRETKSCIREAFWRRYEVGAGKDITVSEVVKDAGYNRATFYTHYGCLDDVLQEIENEILDAMNLCVRRCLEDLEKGRDPESVMQDVLALYEENKRYLVVLLGPEGDPAFSATLKDGLKPLWSRYVLRREDQCIDDEGAYEDDLVLEYTLSGALYMIGKWLRNPGGISAEKLLHLLYHSALKR